MRVYLPKAVLVVSALLLGVFWMARSSHSQAAEGQAVSPKKVIADMKWISGEWSGQAWGGTFNALYTLPSSGTVISHSRLMKGEKVAFYEFEVFEEVDGKVVMQPYPGGRKATSLTLTTHDVAARKATFENPKKDYPTRIVYHAQSPDLLVITLSDPHNDNDKTEVFELKRR